MNCVRIGCRTALLATATLLCLAAAQSGLSKEDIVKLSQSGISANLIIRDIQASGLSFDSNVDNLIELRKLQVSEAVLEAIIALKGAAPLAARKEPTYLETAKETYARGDYPGLVKLSEARLSSQPADFNAHYLLAVAQLRLGHRELAGTELDGLRKLPDPSSKALSASLAKLLGRFDALENAKVSLQTKLSQYNANGALQAIQQMDAPESQKELLRVYVNVYSAKFELARHQLDVLQASQPELEKDWIAVRAFVDQSAAEYRKQYGKFKWLSQSYEHNAWTLNKDARFWVPEGLQDYRDRLKWDIPGARITKAENDRFIQEGFVYAFEAISRMIALTPLSETSLGWLFQVALFTKPYATVERLGDRILNGQGRLIIPMEAKQGQFQMIVDKRQRRLILTQTGSRTVISMDKHYERAEPFDISFDQISQVGQSVKYGTNVFNESVPKDAPRMFEMRPANAVFTETPFLIHFGAMYGELAVRQIVWNFGKFLTHVIDHPQLRSELIKQNAGGGWNFATGILLAAAAGASSATGNAVQAAVIMNSLDRFETETQSEKLQQQQQLQAWESLAADTSFDLIQKDLFRSFDGELEKLH